MNYKIHIIFLLGLMQFSCIHKNEKPQTLHKKAEWIRHAFTSIENNEFPHIKAIAWWQERWENEDGSISDLRINSSPESLEAFQEMISSSLYLTSLNFNNNKLVPSAGGIYFGAFPDFGGPEDNVTTQRIENFENLAHKNIAWAYFSNNWYNHIHFPLQEVQTIHQTGRTPFIRMMARTTLDENTADPNYSLQNIIDGQFDTELREWFRQAAQMPFPLLIEFGTEVNGQWFPWNGIHNGGGQTTAYGDPVLPDGPERFVDAYRHLVDLSRQEGAQNLTWFFHIDAQGQPEEPWNDFENYYPGDDYVDWIGISVYGAVTPDDEYNEFSTKLRPVYDRILILTSKPIAIVETGIIEY